MQHGDYRIDGRRMMNKAPAITCLFVDIGGVLLTDGWDHPARERAATPSSWTGPKWRSGIT